MTILELDDIKLNQGIAYVLGLIYPLYKTGKDNNGNEFIKGCVNYNSILMVDPHAEGNELVALKLWDLTASLPQVSANMGIESV